MSIARNAGWALLSLVIVGVLIGAIVESARKTNTGPPPEVLGTIPDFEFQSEKGTTVSARGMTGSIWVADFIFTRCGMQCPLMTQRMVKLQEWLNSQHLDGVKLLSFSVEPDYDTTAILSLYGQRYGADPKRWSFLTGDHDKIYDLIRNGFKIGVQDKMSSDEVNPKEPILHSPRFVLVDMDRKLRGAYNTEEPDSLERLHNHILMLAGKRER